MSWLRISRRKRRPAVVVVPSQQPGPRHSLLERDGVALQQTRRVLGSVNEGPLFPEETVGRERWSFFSVP